MLDRMSGKIIHIDFGDCFEVAMTREKFPEKIPFRLTRMLINAMEVRFNIVLIHILNIHYYNQLNFLSCRNLLSIIYLYLHNINKYIIHLF